LKTDGIRVVAEGLRKSFNGRVIFDGVSFVAVPSRTLVITGRNGAGKSTLVKIVAGVLSPSRGRVVIDGGGTEFDRQSRIGLVSPYLQLYEEFTAEENLRHASAIRGLPFDARRAQELLERVALFPRKDDPVRTFSSGMKQRAKFAFALLHRPPVLILDEPMSNLDADGIAIVRGIMADQRREGVLIVATNDLTDCDTIDERVDLNGNR
jgi:heme exporter protein A